MFEKYVEREKTIDEMDELVRKSLVELVKVNPIEGMSHGEWRTLNWFVEREWNVTREKITKKPNRKENSFSWERIVGSPSRTRGKMLQDLMENLSICEERKLQN